MRPTHDQATDWPAYHEIRVQEALDPLWSVRLGDFTIRRDPTGTTTIAGCLVDQAALYGLLDQLGDLGLTLVAVSRGETSDSA